jgi:hypothetical protein
MAAEVGTMKVTEQIDALRTLATHTVDHLVVPRVLATLVSAPLLTIESVFVGIVASHIVGVKLLGIDGAYYLANMRRLTDWQDVMIGLIKAARRYDPSRGPFRPYGRTYANGEITHFLRDKGFLLKVPPTWRESHARGQRLLTSGVGVEEMLDRIGMSRTQWIQIVDACSVRVVAFPVDRCP